MLTSLQIGRGGLGRLGNTMFTIAGVIGIAIKSWQPYGFPRWETYDNEIFGQPVDDIENYLLNELPRIPEGIKFQEYGYFWGYRPIELTSGNWTIDAHMQSVKFFEHCMPLIRETFRFKDEKPYGEPGIIAVHYRAGDYIDNPDAQHPRCTREYYEKAMNLLDRGNDTFYVFSDNIEDAKRVIGGIKNNVAYMLNNYIKDFIIMKQCRDFITANSSFSFMAALLGDAPDKRIVMPSHWFGSQMPPYFDTKDIYPENAIVI